jgi:hypothetical protein
MWKKAAVGAAALVIAGSMMVYAQQRGGFDGGRGYDAPRGAGQARDWRPSAQDLSAFADARIAALHAGLQLNADQEKNWPAFEQALRERSKMRIERLSAARDQQQAHQQLAPASPIERLQRRADAMTTRGAALKRLADAAAPLYQSLDDAQKQRFTMLARFMRPHEHHRMVARERFGGGPGGFGGHDGMRGERFHMRRFGEDHGMRGPYGMAPMNRRGDMNGMGGGRQDEEDYGGPL